MKKINRPIGYGVVLSILILLVACSNGKQDSQNKPLTEHQLKYGIGPIEDVQVGAIDRQIATAGQRYFQSNCAKCHMLDRPLLGPPLRDVANRRTPEFIMNMILNPQEMVMRHPILQDYQKQYNIFMTTQGMNRGIARAILEYLRQVAPDKTAEKGASG